jgi:hypothetical protein
MSPLDGLLDHPHLQLLGNEEGIVLGGNGQVIDVEIDDDFNPQSTIQQTQAATNPM